MRNILKILTLSAAAASLAGCAYGGLNGLGYNSGYGYNGYGSPYGYNGYGSPYGQSGVSVSVGYGSGYGGYGYGSPYGYGYGSPYGYGSRYGYGYGSPYGGGYYGSPYFGWYNNSYYPGTGIYVYDAYRRPTVWNDAQRVYWTQQKQGYDQNAAKAGQRSPRTETNWSGFTRDRSQMRTAPQRIERQRTTVRQGYESQREVRQTQRAARAERAKPQRTERTRDRRERRSDD